MKIENKFTSDFLFIKDTIKNEMTKLNSDIIVETDEIVLWQFLPEDEENEEVDTVYSSYKIVTMYKLVKTNDELTKLIVTSIINSSKNVYLETSEIIFGETKDDILLLFDIISAQHYACLNARYTFYRFLLNNDLNLELALSHVNNDIMKIKEADSATNNNRKKESDLN